MAWQPPMTWKDATSCLQRMFPQPKLRGKVLGTIAQLEEPQRLELFDKSSEADVRATLLALAGVGAGRKAFLKRCTCGLTFGMFLTASTWPHFRCHTPGTDTEAATMLNSSSAT